MNHRTHPVLGQQPFEQLGIGNVALQENVPRIAIQGRQILQIAGIGEFVRFTTGSSQPASQSRTAKIAANETGAAVTKVMKTSIIYTKYIVLVDFAG